MKINCISEFEKNHSGSGFQIHTGKNVFEKFHW